jgi:hypothetical protein
MKPIMPDSVSFTAEITEDDLRKRLLEEVLENIGALNPDGSIPPGLSHSVTRGEGRKGGYRVVVTGPVPARLLLPRATD